MELRLSTRPVWIKALLLGAVLLAAGCEKQRITELGKETINADTTWSGLVLLSGDVYVPPGVTLTIAPGTVVKFKRIDEKSDRNLFGLDSPYYPEAEIIFRGVLVAKGTEAEPIIFTSAELDARPADWGALNFLGSEGNVIDHAQIMFAYNGIHAHGASVSVSQSEFSRNGVGISFKKEEETPDAAWFGKPSDLTIVGNRFYRNKGGIGLRNSIATIAHNEIRDNKFFGIWPKDDCRVAITFNEITGNKKGIYLYQVTGMQLANNNIYDNDDYNIAIAEAQDYPVDAGSNWFGSLNREKISESVFDQEDDPSIAKISLDPILEQRVQWEESK